MHQHVGLICPYLRAIQQTLKIVQTLEQLFESLYGHVSVSVGVLGEIAEDVEAWRDEFHVGLRLFWQLARRTFWGVSWIFPSGPSGFSTFPSLVWSQYDDIVG